MPANLASFAIHVDDLDRAQAFYREVFGWRFEAWGPPGFFLVHTGTAASPGVLGTMHRRATPRTGTGLSGVEPTFSVDDLDSTLAAVKQHGGTLTYGPATIPTVGTLIRFLDPEGNDMGAMRYESPPHT